MGHGPTSQRAKKLGRRTRNGSKHTQVVRKGDFVYRCDEFQLFRRPQLNNNQTTTSFLKKNKIAFLLYSLSPPYVIVTADIFIKLETINILEERREPFPLVVLEGGRSSEIEHKLRSHKNG